MPKNILNTQTKFAVFWFVFVGSAGCWLGLLVIGFVCFVSQFVGCVVFQRFVGEEGWSGWRRHPQWAFVQPTRPTTCERRSCTQCQHVTQNNKSNGDAVETTTKFFQRPHVVMSKIFPVICVSLSLYLKVVLQKFRLNISKKEEKGRRKEEMNKNFSRNFYSSAQVVLHKCRLNRGQLHFARKTHSEWQIPKIYQRFDNDNHTIGVNVMISCIHMRAGRVIRERSGVSQQAITENNTPRPEHKHT